MTNFYGQFIGFGAGSSVPPTPPDANPVLTGGELWTCGRATDGGLGVGNTTYYSSPVQVGSQTDWKTGWMGDNASAFIKTTGKLYTWGEAGYGQNGRGDTTDTSSPTQVGSLTDWHHCGGGQHFWNAVKTDGTMWACGRNVSGALGDNSTTGRSSPVQIGSDTDWVRVSPSVYRHAAAIKSDGSLWTWGQGNYGVGGHGDSTSRSSPVQVGALKDWNWVACGKAATAAIKQDGTLWWWGRGNEGDSPLGNTTSYSSPVQVGSLTDWKYIMMRGTTAVVNGGGAIKTDGTLWGWGDNTTGDIGDGTTTTRNSPVQIGSLTNWSTLSGGLSMPFAVKTDGTMWSWGSAAGGAQMHGDVVNRSSPTQIGSLTTWNANRVFGQGGDAHKWGIK